LRVGFLSGREGKERLRKRSTLFGSFKKIKKGFGGLILSNFKVPLNWGVLEG
jgi:hypothetical protein